MKKGIFSLSLVLVMLLSFAATAFAAFSYTSPNVTISSGTIKFGHGVIVNTGKYRDTLTINVYRGNTFVASKQITLNPQEWTYPGSTTTPLLTIATGQPAGEYRYMLSAPGSWHVMAGFAS